MKLPTCNPEVTPMHCWVCWAGLATVVIGILAIVMGVLLS